MTASWMNKTANNQSSKQTKHNDLESSLRKQKFGNWFTHDQLARRSHPEWNVRDRFLAYYCTIIADDFTSVDLERYLVEENAQITVILASGV